LREERHLELDTELARLRKAYPRWSPPAQLLALKQEAEIRLRIAQSIARKDWNGVTALAQQHPGQFVCGQITFLWGWAEAHHALGNANEALSVYQRIIPSCPNAADRTATLQKASATLSAEAYADLLQRETQGGQRDAAQQAALDQVTYEYHLRRFLQAVEAKDTARTIGLIGSFEPALRARRDARNAALAGWVYFDAGQPETAATWFGTALEWDPALEDARYGLALAHFRLNRLDEAEAALRQAKADDPRNRALQGDIALARALKAYEAKDYRRSLEYLDQAEAQGRGRDSGGREIAMLRAWNTYQLGDYPEAARMFTGLYRDRPDRASAEGMVFSLSRSGRWDELAGLARSLGGPLEEQWKTAMAQRYYDRKLFLAAEAAAPGKIPPLHNIATPSIALGASVRDKSGDDGTSRLRLTQVPFVEGVAVFGGTHELRLQLSRVTLDSRNLPANAMVGSFPVAGAYVTTPTTRLTDGYEPYLTYRHQGWLTTYAGIGLTPSGAVLSSAPVGNLGVMQQFDRGSWRAEIFSQPVRESILSYTGIVDPYTGQNWGRVRRNGALVGGYAALTERWSVSAKAQVMDFEGRDVAGNQAVALNLGLATDLKTKLGLRDFDYFSFGPDASYEAYRRNLSHFTLGHGGYFSPEHLIQLGVSAHFLTAEARQQIFKGDFSAGVFDKREAASPCFPGGSPRPVNPACGYAATSDTGFYYSAQLMGVRRLSDNLQVGAAVVFRHSAQYDDKSLMVFLRYVFDPRKVVMSSDLPEGLLQSLY
jgi:tetratricopeptide (TPR) repeat protein